MISIVLPVYNAEKYLYSTINDILNQTYSNYELICVDDGSTDSSGTVLDAFAKEDKRINVVHLSHKGAGAARNYGLDHCKGQYIWFPDSDDRFDRCLLERNIENIENNLLDFSFFDSYYFDSRTGVILSDRKFLKKEYIPQGVFSYVDIPEYIFNISKSSVWNKVYRKQFLDRIGIRFQEVPYMNDSYFANISMAKATRIGFIDSKLIYYRICNSGSVSSASERGKNMLNVFYVLDHIQEELINSNIYDLVWKSFSNYAANHVFWNEKELLLGDFNTYIDKIRNYAITQYQFDRMHKEDYQEIHLWKKIESLKNCDNTTYLYSLMKQLAGIEKNLIFRSCKERLKEVTSDGIILDIPRVETGSRIIIYGAGEYGMALYNAVRITQKYRVVAWVDKNYMEFDDRWAIISPNQISNVEFDWVVIAVEKREIMLEIRSELQGHVDLEKIVWY